MRKILIILFCLVGFSVNAKPTSLINKDWDREIYSGRAFIVDGDTLRINGITVRLAGVDAPELSQTCEIQGHTERCGEIVKLRLVQVTDSSDVLCYDYGRDFYGRVLGECYVNGININKWLLREGLAVYYYNKNFKSYKILEKLAKEEKNGLWDGKFQKPKDYRKARRLKK